MAHPLRCIDGTPQPRRGSVTMAVFWDSSLTVLPPNLTYPSMDGRIRTAGLDAPMALSRTDLGSQSPLGTDFSPQALSES